MSSPLGLVEFELTRFTGDYFILVLPILRRRVRGVAQEERPHPREQECHDHDPPVPLAHVGRESTSVGAGEESDLSLLRYDLAD
jgi:hypothetical protein